MYWAESASFDRNGSAEFFISGPGFSDALWWYKAGPNNTGGHYSM